MAKSSKDIFARPRMWQLTSFFIRLFRKSVASATPTPSTQLRGLRHARPSPCLGTTHADYFRGAIPVTDIISDSDIAGAYEENTGHAIARLFKNLDPGEIPAVLVANHAPFTWGVTPAEASHNAIILETVAKLAYFALQIHPDAAAAPRALIDRHFLRKHGSATSYGQPKDK